MRRVKSLLLAFVVPLVCLPLQTTSQQKAARVWTPESAKRAQDLFFKFNDAVKVYDLAKTISLGNQLCNLDDQPSERYDLACVLARNKRLPEALTWLGRAIDCAPNDPSFRIAETMRNDSDLDALRKLPAFASLMKRADAAQWRPAPLVYEKGSPKEVRFSRNDLDSPYLATLRSKYNLEALIAGARGDMERVKVLCTWVHTRWNHVGSAENQPVDPIGLLEAAQKGDNFRCVEYGVTVAGCLNAVGIPARVVGGRAKDVETRRFGAGHVFAEAYLRDQKQWVFVDPQMNVVGELNGKPLNTVEFRQALSEPHPKVQYNPVLGSCFYYFSYELDARWPLDTRSPGSILLAPKGAPIPKRFQRLSFNAPKMTTHNPADVYGAPPSTP